MKKTFVMQFNKVAKRAGIAVLSIIKRNGSMHLWHDELSEDKALTQLPQVTKLDKYGNKTMFAITALIVEEHNRIVVQGDGIMDRLGEREEFTLWDVDSANMCFLADVLAEEVAGKTTLSVIVVKTEKDILFSGIKNQKNELAANHAFEKAVMEDKNVWLLIDDEVWDSSVKEKTKK